MFEVIKRYQAQTRWLALKVLAGDGVALDLEMWRVHRGAVAEGKQGPPTIFGPLENGLPSRHAVEWLFPQGSRLVAVS